MSTQLGRLEKGTSLSGAKSQLLPEPKFRLREHIIHEHHRSGWGYALKSIEPLLREDTSGILLDSAIEQSFWKTLAKKRRDGTLPYREPWVGIVHNPPYIPRWHVYRKSTSYISQLATWQRSMEHCRGLFTLSEHSAEWLRGRVEVPVEALRHPTELPLETWSPAKFRANRNRRLVQVGWWLRRLGSLHQTPVRRLRKTLLWPGQDATLRRRFRELVERERRQVGGPSLSEWDVEQMGPVSNGQYDALLARNIVLLHLWGSVANNTIIECIVRRTPVLVNPLPSVKEYLGEGYPLYFDTCEEAGAKADDFSLVEQAHEYLCEIPIERFSGDTFRDRIANSAIYRGLEDPARRAA